MQRPTTITGIDHIKLAASSLDATRKFYCDVLGFKYLQHFDHKKPDGSLFAVMLEFQHKTSSGSGTPILCEIRLNPAQATAQQGWDPITFGCPKKSDLNEWAQFFESQNVRCSRVFTGLKGWVLCALDPDGKIVRIYCQEEHEWTTDFDQDDFWLPLGS